MTIAELWDVMIDWGDLVPAFWGGGGGGYNPWSN